MSSGKEGVIVCLRFRPLNSNEKRKTKDKISIQFHNDRKGDIKTVQLQKDVAEGMRLAKNKKFAFDRIFNWKHSQKEVYKRTAAPMVADVFKGFNCTVFAYGQTGTGKSYSMMGVLGNAEKEGIIPRIVDQIFSTIEKAISVDEPEDDYEVQVSYIEIYMERVKDLLNPANQRGNCKIREDPVKGIYIQGVTEQWVTNADEVYRQMDIGSCNRAVASTKMNSESSRSHSVFSLKVSKINIKTQSKRISKVFLVDLAGSEKVRKTEAKGQTLKEANMINRSLSALGNVIHALTENKPHIPYRNSKLTRLLSDSLGGNAKTCLILTASPALYNAEETLSTMRFGARAKMIKNKPKVNAERTVEEYKKLLAEAEKRIAQQDAIIAALKSGGGGGSYAYETEKTSDGTEKVLNESHISTSGGKDRKSNFGQMAAKVASLVEERDALKAVVAELKEEVEESNLVLKAAEEGREEIARLKEEQREKQLEMAEEFAKSKELERKAFHIKISTLEEEKKTLQQQLDDQQETLTKKLKTFMPSFDQIKEEAGKCETPEQKRIKTLELENSLLVEDLTRKCQEFIQLSCENDEMKSKMKLFETVGPGGVYAKENSALKQTIAKLKGESTNNSKLASARSEQIQIIEKALEKAISESRLYKQGMEESQARLRVIIHGSAAPSPRAGASSSGRRHTRVFPNMRRRIGRPTITAKSPISPLMGRFSNRNNPYVQPKYSEGTLDSKSVATAEDDDNATEVEEEDEVATPMASRNPRALFASSRGAQTNATVFNLDDAMGRHQEKKSNGNVKRKPNGLHLPASRMGYRANSAESSTDYRSVASNIVERAASDSINPLLTGRRLSPRALSPTQKAMLERRQQRRTSPTHAGSYQMKDRRTVMERRWSLSAITVSSASSYDDRGDRYETSTTTRTTISDGNSLLNEEEEREIDKMVEETERKRTASLLSPAASSGLRNVISGGSTFVRLALSGSTSSLSPIASRSKISAISNNDSGADSKKKVTFKTESNTKKLSNTNPAHSFLSRFYKFSNSST